MVNFGMSSKKRSYNMIKTYQRIHQSKLLMRIKSKQILERRQIQTKKTKRIQQKEKHSSNKGYK